MITNYNPKYIKFSNETLALSYAKKYKQKYKKEPAMIFKGNCFLIYSK